MIQPSDSPARPLDKKDAILAAVLWLAGLLLYMRTLVPGLIPGDSAEFQTLAYTLGHAHTTGYEVYTLLARLFAFLPVQDMAYRVNLFSAFMGALTIALVYLAGKVLSGSRGGATLGAITLAVAPTFWSQAVMAEVYTPGAAFTAAILLMVLLWHETGHGRYLLVAGTLGGLSIGVHTSNALFAPAILALLILRGRDLRGWWQPALGGALIGLALFLAAFALVDAINPPSSSINTIYQPSASRWDVQPEELDTFGGRLSYLVLARQWRSAMFADSSQVNENLARLSAARQRDFSPLLNWLLVGLGMAALIARRTQLGIFFVAALLMHLVYTLNYRIGDIHVFFISLYVYMAALAAEGVATVMRFLMRMAPRPEIGYYHWRPLATAFLLVMVMVPFIDPTIEALRQGQVRWDFMGVEPNERLAEWRAVLSYNVKALPPNAVVLTDWYDLYGYAYVAAVEEGRHDIQFIETYPYATKPGLADSLLDYLHARLAEGRPVLATQRYEELQRGELTLRMQSVGLSTFYTVTAR